VVNNAIAKVMRDPAGYCAKLELQQPQQEGEAAAETDKKPKKKKKWQPPKKHTPREFRMDNYASRAVAVKFLYDGEKYAGFARQEHMDATVERFLFDALVRTRLIADIDSCDYSRCGRTDRGVSAFGQVITLRVRSNLPANAKLLDVASIDEVRAGDKFRVELPSGEVKTLTEIDYAAHMNRTLPPEIRVYSVVACVPEFNARFDCHGRVYRYFFVKNQLDVDKMREAAQQLVGLHDFRNFCRIDHNCHTFERSIRGFEIVPCETGETRDPAHQMYRFEVRHALFDGR
jgi:tRNA pseudouridine38/39 synthase